MVIEKPNFILENTAISQKYASPQRSFQKNSISRNRDSHAQYLLNSWNTATENAQKQKAYAVSERNGIYLQFEGAKDAPLEIKGLENLPLGIRLLNTPDDNGIRKATVFIPKGKESIF